LDPGREDARLKLAEELVRAHLPDQSLPHFEQLFQTQPDNEAVLLGLAHCRHLLNQLDDARQLLHQVLDTSPDNSDALGELGRLELEAGRPEEAEHWLRRAWTLAPYDRETTYALYL